MASKRFRQIRGKLESDVWTLFSNDLNKHFRSHMVLRWKQCGHLSLKALPFQIQNVAIQVEVDFSLAIERFDVALATFSAELTGALPELGQAMVALTLLAYLALLRNATVISYLRHFRGFKGQTSSACGCIR